MEIHHTRGVTQVISNMSNMYSSSLRFTFQCEPNFNYWERATQLIVHPPARMKTKSLLYFELFKCVYLLSFD